MKGRAARAFPEGGVWPLTGVPAVGAGQPRLPNPPQIERLNTLLGSPLPPNHALEASVAAGQQQQQQQQQQQGSRPPLSGVAAAFLPAVDGSAMSSVDCDGAESGSPFFPAGPRLKRDPGSCNTMSTAASDHASREYCHKNVPRHCDLEEEARSNRACMEPKLATTLMIRNVPNRYTQHDLLAELDDLGLDGTFDFLYMPVDKASKASVGYAFVNFVAPSWASRCVTVLQEYKFTRYGKNREAIVSVAHLQGLDANLAHYEKTSVRSSKFKQHRPLIFAGSKVLPPPR